MGAGVLVLKRKSNASGQANKLSKTPKQMERHLKGVANHRRIEILLLIAQNPESSVEDISDVLNCNYKTLSIHTFRLVNAGLIDKKHKGRRVVHQLTPYGKVFVSFLKTFQHS